MEAFYRIRPMFGLPVASYTVEAPINGLIELGPGWTLEREGLSLNPDRSEPRAERRPRGNDRPGRNPDFR